MYREDDLIFHVDSTLSPIMLNQLSVVLEQDRGQNLNAGSAADQRERRLCRRVGAERFGFERI
jgi:hypothetical protein